MLTKLIKLIYKIEEYIAMFMIIAMVLVVTWSVICRYVLKIPFLIGEELSRYLMIYSVFIGIGIGVRRGSHLGVRAIVEVLPKKLQHLVNCIQQVITAIMFLIFAYVSLKMVLQFYSTSQVSTMMRVPMFIVYLILVIGFIFSSIHSFEELVQYVKKNKKVEEC